MDTSEQVGCLGLQGVVLDIQFRRRRQLDDEDIFELAIEGLLLPIRSSAAKVCVAVNE
jgi:hypothetical protein